MEYRYRGDNAIHTSFRFLFKRSILRKSFFELGRSRTFGNFWRENFTGRISKQSTEGISQTNNKSGDDFGRWTVSRGTEIRKEQVLSGSILYTPPPGICGDGYIIEIYGRAVPIAWSGGRYRLIWFGINAPIHRYGGAISSTHPSPHPAASSWRRIDLWSARPPKHNAGLRRYRAARLSRPVIISTGTARTGRLAPPANRA